MSIKSTTTESNLSVFVKGSVNEGKLEEFYKNSIINARNSILERGISRFDILSQVDKNNNFLLIEVYNSLIGPDEHKTTDHYNEWRESVASMMATPRTNVKYSTLFPFKKDWYTSPTVNKIDTLSHIKDHPWPENQDLNSLMKSSLLVVVVDIQVKQEFHDQFIEACLKNCKNSIKEPGIHRFDFLQNNADSSNFLLVEAYNNIDAPAAHKNTSHYKEWASEVAVMMERPRSAIKYASLFPPPLHWHHAASVSRSAHNLDVSWNAVTGLGLSQVSGQSFSFLSPKILFGRGVANTAITSTLKNKGVKKPLVVIGKSGRQRYESLLDSIAAVVDGITWYTVAGEPTVENAEEATALAKSHGCDGVVAVGGGSAIDLAKAVSALITNKGDIYDYLEVIGNGMAIKNRPLPFIAVPTTSGTGSEATKNAVLKSEKFKRKVSIRHDWMLPTVAIIDPLLTLTCPPDVTACVGLDALCQVIEPYISNAANPFTDALAREAILRASRSLRTVVAEPDNIEAREDMSVASVLGGLCLANSKLGAVHGFAGVLGGMFESAAHGALCALFLPEIFARNAQLLADLSLNGDDPTATDRFARCTEVARIITGDPDATALQGSLWLEAIAKDVGIPSLSSLCPQLTESQVTEIVQATASASSTKGNPVLLTEQQLESILRTVLSKP